MSKSLYAKKSIGKKTMFNAKLGTHEAVLFVFPSDRICQTMSGKLPVQIGIILCAQKDSSLAKYSLEGLPNKVLATEYKLQLPSEKVLAKEIEKTRKMLEKSKP